jgi:hypothetical protein
MVFLIGLEAVHMRALSIEMSSKLPLEVPGERNSTFEEEQILEVSA